MAPSPNLNSSRLLSGSGLVGIIGFLKSVGVYLGSAVAPKMNGTLTEPNEDANSDGKFSPPDTDSSRPWTSTTACLNLWIKRLKYLYEITEFCCED